MRVIRLLKNSLIARDRNIPLGVRVIRAQSRRDSSGRLQGDAPHRL
jgi:hypothetical protein